MNNTTKINILNEKPNNIFKMCDHLKKEFETLEKQAKEENKIGFEDDPIFLLSVEEYKKYKDKIPTISYDWWLRSPGYRSNYAASVSSGGSVYSSGDSVGYSNFAVRPALKISNLECDSEIVYNSARTYFFALGAIWKVVDEEKGIAISEMPIMFSCFDAELNDYATSEVRKELLDWYKERIEW